MTRPSWPRLVAIQFGFIFRSGRWIELIGGVAALLGLVLTTSDKTMAVPIRLSNAEGPWMVLVLFLVAAWPVLLWRGESPRQRRYHWSLPVARGPHDLARVAAGALWVLIVGAIMATVCDLMFPKQLLLATAGDTILSGRIVVLLPAGLSRNAGGYCLGLLTVYCLSSIAAVAAASPARWLVGSLIGYALVSLLLVLASTRLGENFLGRWSSLASGRYGFVSATGGSLRDGEGALLFDFVAPSGAQSYGPDSIFVTMASGGLGPTVTIAPIGVTVPRGLSIPALRFDSTLRAMGPPRIAHAGITVRQPHEVQDWYESSSMTFSLSPPRYVLGPASPATVAAFDSRFGMKPFFTRFFNPEWAAASALWLFSSIAILLLVSVSRHER